MLHLQRNCRSRSAVLAGAQSVPTFDTRLVPRKGRGRPPVEGKEAVQYIRDHHLADIHSPRRSPSPTLPGPYPYLHLPHNCPRTSMFAMLPDIWMLDPPAFGSADPETAEGQQSM